MTTTGGQGGILAQLDNRSATSFYWYLALLATVGGFLFGYDSSNIGSVLGFIPVAENARAEDVPQSGLIRYYVASATTSAFGGAVQVAI